MKKITFNILLILVVAVVASFSAVLTQLYLMPKLSASSWGQKYDFLKKSTETVTIIEKTEQVTIKEDDSINAIAGQAQTSLVNIISIKKTKPAVESLGMSGTGLIATSDGLVITYKDAIDLEDSNYKALIFNGDEFDAELLGVDPFTNLAFLKINSTNLPAIAFANSDDYFPGKKLIAIGNAFGEYQNRYATGLLSNINKTLNISGQLVSSSEKLEGVFEVDFNEENEYLGGPIIDYNGEMVGVIGSVEIDSEIKYFLIPANQVKGAMNLAIANELDQRAQFGAYYLSITKVYSEANHLNRDRGALIHTPSGISGLAVLYGSAAQKAGLKVGDIIIAINGTEINLDNPLSNVLSNYNKGDKVTVKYIRAGEEKQVIVEL